MVPSSEDPGISEQSPTSFVEIGDLLPDGKEPAMQAPLDLEIRQQLARYLAKQITLDDFEDWFVAESWNVHRDENTAATDLVFEIELRLG